MIGRRPLLVLFALVLAGLPAEAACLSQKQVRKAVKAGDAMRLSEVVSGIEGEVINAELCERGGRLVWRLQVIKPKGKVGKVVVDARTGAIEK